MGSGGVAWDGVAWDGIAWDGMGCGCGLGRGRVAKRSERASERVSE